MPKISMSDPSQSIPFGDEVPPAELAARLAARLCHDFISPASAIVSGIDLIEDPDQQDMREDALNLIAASARKLAALLSFSRIAYGGSSASESFDVRDLEKLTQGFYEHVRAELDWTCEPASLDKPAARALLNLAELGAAVLPMGGKASVKTTAGGGETHLALDAEGARVRLRPETLDGLEGRAFDQGMAGHWVQAYFLRSIVAQAGGSMEIEVEPEAVRIRVTLPTE